MFTSLFSFSSRNLFCHEYSKFSLCGQLHWPEHSKCNVLHLADCQNQLHHKKVYERVEFLRLIHLDRLIKKPVPLKIKSYFPDRENVGHHTNKFS